MTDKIAEIRARHQEGIRAGVDVDRAYLLAEVERLLAEVERQARHIEELQRKIAAEKSCACSYDAPGDVCAAHSPTLAAARTQVERLRAALAFYADQRSYRTTTVHMCGHPVGQPVVVDGGAQARKALEDGR